MERKSNNFWKVLILVLLAPCALFFSLVFDSYNFWIMKKKSPMSIGMPLLFQELAIPRLPYKVPFVKFIVDLRFPRKAVRYTQTDLPLSDLEFCITYPDVAREIGLLK